MSARKKMSPAEKEAFLARINKGKKIVKPKDEIAAPRPSKLNPDPNGKYPKVEIGHWDKNKKRLGKFVGDAFKLKHQDVEQGEERAGDKPNNVDRVESAKPDQKPLHSPN